MMDSMKCTFQLVITNWWYQLQVQKLSCSWKGYGIASIVGIANSKRALRLCRNLSTNLLHKTFQTLQTNNSLSCDIRPLVEYDEVRGCMGVSHDVGWYNPPVKAFVELEDAWKLSGPLCVRAYTRYNVVTSQRGGSIGNHCIPCF